MADKRQVTLIELTIALDGQYGQREVEQLFIPEIKKVCSMVSMKYAPEAWANKVETVTMDIVPKG